MKKNLIVCLISFLLTPGLVFANCDTTFNGVCVSTNEIVRYKGLLTTTPAVSSSGQATMYFDMSLGKLQCSEDGAAYADCVGGGTSIVFDTVANLPAVPSASDLAGVTDGSTVSDCTAGGGSNYNICVYDGASWVIVGDGTSIGGGNSIYFAENSVEIGNNNSANINWNVIESLQSTCSGQLCTQNVNWSYINENELMQSGGVNWDNLNDNIGDAAINWDDIKNIDSVDSIQFNILATSITNAEGLLQWNDTDGTLDLGMSGGDITQQIGQELFAKVRNDPGYETISNGQAVYISGRTGVYASVEKARSDALATSRVLGIATQDIASPGYGYITTFGYVRGIKTDYTGAGTWGTTWNTGDILYISETNAGVLTNVEPSAPHFSDRVGSVGIISATVGTILVDIDRHYSLQELTDVNGTALSTNGQLPVWDNDNGYFDFTSNISDFLAVAGTDNVQDSNINWSNIESITDSNVNWQAFPSYTDDYYLRANAPNGVVFDVVSGGGATTDGGDVTYVTSATDDFAIGGTDVDAIFFFDVGDETAKFGTGSAGVIDFGVNTLTDTTAGNLKKGYINLPVQSAKITGTFVTDGTPAQGAGIDAGEGAWLLLFDTTTSESGVWQTRIPYDFNDNMVAKIQWSQAEDCSSEEVEWEIQIMCVAPSASFDIDTASFATAASTGNVSCPITAGYPLESSLTLTDDSCVAGDMIWVKLYRDVANDDASGDAELINLQIEYDRD